MDETQTHEYAEGRILEFQSEEGIRAEWLKTFPYVGAPQQIEYKTEEFSPVCPFSGLPDFGRLCIHYEPQQLIVELKSLKYYLVSYRNVGIYQEPATNRIYQDLWRLLQPRWLSVETSYRTRGGIDATCRIDSRSNSDTI